MTHVQSRCYMAPRAAYANSKAMRIAIGLWVILLAALSGMILWLGKT